MTTMNWLTAAAVLLATPSHGWTTVSRSTGSSNIRSRRRGSLLPTSDSTPRTPTTTSRSMAASLIDGTNDYDYSEATWPHRVLRKVFRRNGQRRGATTTLTGKADLQEALNLMGRPFDLTLQHEQLQKQTFSVQDFNRFGNEIDPSVAMPAAANAQHLVATAKSQPIPLEATLASSASLQPALLGSSDPAASVSETIEQVMAASETDSIALDMATTLASELPSVAELVMAEPMLTTDGGSPFVRLTRPWVQSILEGLLDRWSQGSHVNMMIQCHPQSKTLDLVQGRFACDASVDFDRIVFGPIRMHRGRIEVNRLALGVWSLTPNAIPIRGHRYLNQFEFMGRNVTFTQADLVESRCIRNGLKNLLARILKLRGTKAVRISIETIHILPNGKISCRGSAKTVFGKILEFEVRSGLAFSSRGHVLNFPDLSISLSPGLGIFVPVLPAISLDLGHNAQLLDLNIDGATSEMTVSARVTIAPHHTLKLRKYKQSQDAYLAQYSVDVGRWLTRLGNFTS